MADDQYVLFPDTALPFDPAIPPGTPKWLAAHCRLPLHEQLVRERAWGWHWIELLTTALDRLTWCRDEAERALRGAERLLDASYPTDPDHARLCQAVLDAETHHVRMSTLVQLLRNRIALLVTANA
jgi:hypothetical protein